MGDCQEGKNYFLLCRPETQTLRRTASAECRRTSWRRGGLSSASTAAVEAVRDNPRPQDRLQQHHYICCWWSCGLSPIFNVTVEDVMDKSSNKFPEAWRSIKMCSQSSKCQTIIARIAPFDTYMCSNEHVSGSQRTDVLKLSCFPLQRCNSNGAHWRVQDPQQGKTASNNEGFWPIQPWQLLLFPNMDISQEAREPSCRTPSSVCTPGNGNCSPKTLAGNNAHTPKAGPGNQLHTPKSTAGNNPHTPMSERQQLALIRHMEEEGRGGFCFLSFSHMNLSKSVHCNTDKEVMLLF